MYKWLLYDDKIIFVYLISLYLYYQLQLKLIYLE